MEDISITEELYTGKLTKKHKRRRNRASASQKIGPLTLDFRLSPLNRRRNQASFHLDIIESYDIVTHKKKMKYDLTNWDDIKKLRSYVSMDRINSFIATVKAEFSEVE